MPADDTSTGPGRSTPRWPRRLIGPALLALLTIGVTALIAVDTAQAADPGSPFWARPAAGVITAMGTAPGAGGRIILPPPRAVFDDQLGGGYPPAAGVGIADRNLGEGPAPGVYNICHLDAFQVRTGHDGDWPDGLLLRANGNVVRDGQGHGALLDTRTEADRAAIAASLHPWLAACAEKGFDAVEPDDLDSWERSGGLLSAQDNVELAALLVRDAHQLGLAAAQKNGAAESGAIRARAGFDFAIAENCQHDGQCAAYTWVYGDQVYELEYADGGPGDIGAACADHGARISITYRDRAAVPTGRPGYTFEHC
jgi:hypothetical protein